MLANACLSGVYGKLVLQLIDLVRETMPTRLHTGNALALCSAHVPFVKRRGEMAQVIGW